VPGESGYDVFKRGHINVRHGHLRRWSFSPVERASRTRWLQTGTATIVTKTEHRHAGPQGHASLYMVGHSSNNTLAIAASGPFRPSVSTRANQPCQRRR